MRRKNLDLFNDNTEEEPNINLTSLIDVVFVLLITFIIVAPMLELDRVSLASSHKHENADPRSVQDTSSITIHVHSDNTITVNSKPISKDQLYTLLKKEKLAHPKAIPQIFHDRKAYFETYQLVKDSLESAGYEEVDIILKPQ